MRLHCYQLIGGEICSWWCTYVQLRPLLCFLVNLVTYVIMALACSHVCVYYWLTLLMYIQDNESRIMNQIVSCLKLCHFLPDKYPLNCLMIRTYLSVVYLRKCTSVCFYFGCTSNVHECLDYLCLALPAVGQKPLLLYTYKVPRTQSWQLK